jgi:Na+-driven multidrug efflux pump
VTEPDRPDAGGRRIAGLALPALGVLAAEPLYLLFDTAVVGRLGALSLAGLAIGDALHGRELAVAASMTPMLGRGFVAARLLLRRVDPDLLRAGVRVVCATGSLVLLIRSITG